MKGLLWIVAVLLVVGGALKMAGIDLPTLDYPLGPIDVFDGRGPAMPDIQIEPPGFGEFPAP